MSSGIAADEATPFRPFHNLRIVARGNELRDTSLANCCALALEHGIEPGRVRKLIQAQGLAPGERAATLKNWPWELCIEAPGSFRLIVRGVPVTSEHKAQTKPLELLQFMVAGGPSGARQNLLLEALWGDLEGAAAQRALATTLYRLRKVLGRGDAIVQNSGRVFLDARHVFVDVWALEWLLEQVEALPPAGERGAAQLERLRSRIASLYRGDLFGADDDPRFAQEREQLRRRVARWLRAAPDPAR